MSADVLALAARAAAAYAGVRGPWRLRCSTMVLEHDPLNPRLLVVRDPTPGATRKPLIVDPCPRKEISVTASPLPIDDDDDDDVFWPTEKTQRLLHPPKEIPMPAPPPSPDAPATIWMESGVSAFSGEPFCSIGWEAQSGQLTPEEMRAHGRRALEVAEAAIHDAAMWKWLREKLELDETRAAEAIADLRLYRADQP